MSVAASATYGVTGLLGVLGGLVCYTYGALELWEYGTRSREDDRHDDRHGKDHGGCNGCNSGKQGKIAAGWVLFAAGVILSAYGLFCYWESMFAIYWLSFGFLLFLFISIAFNVMGKGGCGGCRGCDCGKKKHRRRNDGGSSSSESNRPEHSSGSSSSSNAGRRRIIYSDASASDYSSTDS